MNKSEIFRIILFILFTINTTIANNLYSKKVNEKLRIDEKTNEISLQIHPNFNQVYKLHIYLKHSYLITKFEYKDSIFINFDIDKTYTKESYLHTKIKIAPDKKSGTLTLKFYQCANNSHISINDKNDYEIILNEQKAGNIINEITKFPILLHEYFIIHMDKVKTMNIEMNINDGKTILTDIKAGVSRVNKLYLAFHSFRNKHDGLMIKLRFLPESNLKLLKIGDYVTCIQIYDYASLNFKITRVKYSKSKTYNLNETIIVECTGNHTVKMKYEFIVHPNIIEHKNMYYKANFAISLYMHKKNIICQSSYRTKSIMIKLNLYTYQLTKNSFSCVFPYKMTKIEFKWKCFLDKTIIEIGTDFSLVTKYYHYTSIFRRFLVKDNLLITKKLYSDIDIYCSCVFKSESLSKTKVMNASREKFDNFTFISAKVEMTKSDTMKCMHTIYDNVHTFYSFDNGTLCNFLKIRNGRVRIKKFPVLIYSKMICMVTFHTKIIKKSSLIQFTASSKETVNAIINTGNKVWECSVDNVIKENLRARKYQWFFNVEGKTFLYGEIPLDVKERCKNFFTKINVTNDLLEFGEKFVPFDIKVACIITHSENIPKISRSSWIETTSSNLSIIRNYKFNYNNYDVFTDKYIIFEYTLNYALYVRDIHVEKPFTLINSMEESNYTRKLTIKLNETITECITQTCHVNISLNSIGDLSFSVTLLFVNGISNKPQSSASIIRINKTNELNCLPEISGVESVMEYKSNDKENLNFVYKDGKTSLDLSNQINSYDLYSILCMRKFKNESCGHDGLLKKTQIYIYNKDVKDLFKPTVKEPKDFSSNGYICTIRDTIRHIHIFFQINNSNLINFAEVNGSKFNLYHEKTPDIHFKLQCLGAIKYTKLHTQVQLFKWIDDYDPLLVKKSNFCAEKIWRSGFKCNKNSNLLSVLFVIGNTKMLLYYYVEKSTLFIDDLYKNDVSVQFSNQMQCIVFMVSLKLIKFYNRSAIFCKSYKYTFSASLKLYNVTIGFTVPFHVYINKTNGHFPNISTYTSPHIEIKYELSYPTKEVQQNKVDLNITKPGLYQIIFVITDEKVKHVYNRTYYTVIYDSDLNLQISPQKIVVGERLFCMLNNTIPIYFLRWLCKYGKYTINAELSNAWKKQNTKLVKEERTKELVFDSLYFESETKPLFLLISYEVFDISLKCYCIASNHLNRPSVLSKHVYIEVKVDFQKLFQKHYQFQRIHKASYLSVGILIGTFVHYIYLMFTCISVNQVFMYEFTRYVDLLQQRLYNFRFGKRDKPKISYDDYSFDMRHMENTKAFLICRQRYYLLVAIKLVITELNYEFQMCNDNDRIEYLQHNLCILFILIDKREECPYFEYMREDTSDMQEMSIMLYYMNSMEQDNSSLDEGGQDDTILSTTVENQKKKKKASIRKVNPVKAKSPANFQLSKKKDVTLYKPIRGRESQFSTFTTRTEDRSSVSTRYFEKRKLSSFNRIINDAKPVEEPDNEDKNKFTRKPMLRRSLKMKRETLLEKFLPPTHWLLAQKSTGEYNGRVKWPPNTFDISKPFKGRNDQPNTFDFPKLRIGRTEMNQRRSTSILLSTPEESAPVIQRKSNLIMPSTPEESAPVVQRKSNLIMPSTPEESAPVIIIQSFSSGMVKSSSSEKIKSKASTLAANEKLPKTRKSTKTETLKLPKTKKISTSTKSTKKESDKPSKTKKSTKKESDKNSKKKKSTRRSTLTLSVIPTEHYNHQLSKIPLRDRYSQQTRFNRIENSTSDHIVVKSRGLSNEFHSEMDSSKKGILKTGKKSKPKRSKSRKTKFKANIEDKEITKEKKAITKKSSMSTLSSTEMSDFLFKTRSYETSTQPAKVTGSKKPNSQPKNKQKTKSKSAPKKNKKGSKQTLTKTMSKQTSKLETQTPNPVTQTPKPVTQVKLSKLATIVEDSKVPKKDKKKAKSNIKKPKSTSDKPLKRARKDTKLLVQSDPNLKVIFEGLTERMQKISAMDSPNVPVDNETKDMYQGNLLVQNILRRITRSSSLNQEYDDVRSRVSKILNKYSGENDLSSEIEARNTQQARTHVSDILRRTIQISNPTIELSENDQEDVSNVTNSEISNPKEKPVKIKKETYKKVARSHIANIYTFAKRISDSKDSNEQNNSETNSDSESSISPKK